MLDNVLLPFMAPNTKSLREAVRNIILDIQRETGESDHETAERLGISVGTLRNARDRKNDLGALTIARIGFEYGDGAIEPYRALYQHTAKQSNVPTGPVADALSHLVRALDHKGRLDSLPACKEAHEALGAYINSLECERLRLVS